MNDPQEHQGVAAVRAALERRPEINLHRNPIELRLDGDTLVLQGEVNDIAAKRAARRAAIGELGVAGVRDELRVTPGQRRGDGEIATDLERTLKQELAFRDYLTTAYADAAVPPPETQEVRQEGVINAGVRDGVVTLEGTVESLTHQRLAEVLAWWTPGTREVVDSLRVVPEQRDTDEEVSDAIHMVLEKDPALNEGQIAVEVKDHRVTLKGMVEADDQWWLATRDVWYVPGVEDVDNRLVVSGGEAR